MTHEKFIELWERACKSPRRVQSMYFGGAHGFCSEWKIELWSHGRLGAVLKIANCGIWDREGSRKTWRLIPYLNEAEIGGKWPACLMNNEQSLRCVGAYDEGLKLAPLQPIEDLL